MQSHAVGLGEWSANALLAPFLRHIHAELLRPGGGGEGGQDGGLQRVSNSYQKQLVEAFRSVAEILIWGDQNDTRVFE